jgi:hypothetical protein
LPLCEVALRYVARAPLAPLPSRARVAEIARGDSFSPGGSAAANILTTRGALAGSDHVGARPDDAFTSGHAGEVLPPSQGKVQDEGVQQAIPISPGGSAAANILTTRGALARSDHVGARPDDAFTSGHAGEVLPPSRGKVQDEGVQQAIPISPGGRSRCRGREYTAAKGMYLIPRFHPHRPVAAPPGDGRDAMGGRELSRPIARLARSRRAASSPATC